MRDVVTCEGVRVGPVPDAALMEALKDAGIRTLLDVREAGEGSSPNPAEAESLAASLGLGYRCAPLSKRWVDLAQMDAFRAVVTDAQAAPVYAFSGSGRRAAGALCFLRCAQVGDSVLEVFRKAKGCGLAIDKEQALKRFILDFYSSHRGDMLNNYFRHHAL